MNVESPMLDVGECKTFLLFWREVTGAPHVTLTAITPDGPTTTATFAEPDAAASWIERQQSANRNIYFQPNETPARCAKKPTKGAMQAALCRHADIDPDDDPDDGGQPYREERQRLHQLAEFLVADPNMPPTVVLDSGNGIQPLWVVARESLTPEIIERIEGENRAIEAAVGAAGTHNIDRLLRLPGTVNYPNAKKQKLGRGISRARLLHLAPAAYTAEEAAMLGDHLAGRLAGSDLVRPVVKAAEPPPKDEKPANGRKSRDRSRSALRIGADIRRDGGTFEDMVEALRTDPETADWFKEKGERDNQRELKRIWAKTAPKPSKAGLPIIYNSAGRLHIIASDAERALVKSGRPIFQRGEMLFRPIVMDVAASKGRTTKAAGLKEIDYHSLVDLMAQTATWQRWDARSETWVDDDPNGQAGNILLSRCGSWSFPAIAGVITTPTIRPDGTVLLDAGYDPATRLYHAKDTSLDLSRLPANPTRTDAERALKLLKRLIEGFPFVGPVDRAVALSGILTPVVRGAITVAPLHAIKATTAGTGKSYLVDITSTIATGRICPVASAAKDAAETEKRLVGLMLAGYPILSLDNVNGELGGDLLCQAVERPLVRVRKLGGSDIFEIESRASIYATGNALRVVGDMTRRTLCATLDAQMERPELREFSSNPVAEILADRGRYVAACLAIVLAYQQAGCPGLLPPLASFEDWSDLVRSALVWLGEEDPCMSMEAAREEDPELSELREMAALWHGAVGTDARTLRAVVETANEHELTSMGVSPDLAHPEFLDALTRLAGDRGTVNTKRLARWLADHAGRIVTVSSAISDAQPSVIKRLRFARGANAEGGIVRWKIEAVR